MGTKRGIVIERGERHAILLTPGGEFLRVSAVRPEWAVGQEVTVAWPEPTSLPGRRVSAGWARRPLWVVAVVAAAVALLLVAQGVLPTFLPSDRGPVAGLTPPGASPGGPPPEPPDTPLGADPNAGAPTDPHPGVDASPAAPDDRERFVVAYVTVDINPSVELGLDAAGRVVTVRALNGEGDDLVDQLPLEGMTAEEAIARLTEAAVAKRYLGADRANAVVIAAVPAPVGADAASAPVGAGSANMAAAGRTPDGEARRQLVAKLEARLPEVARQIVAQRSIPSQVVGVSAPPAALEAANREGVSAGRLLVVLDARRHGVKIEVEDVRDSALGEALRRAGGNPKQVLDALKAFVDDADDDLKKFAEEQEKRAPRPDIRRREPRKPIQRDDAGRDGRDDDREDDRDDDDRSRRGGDDPRRPPVPPGRDVRIPVPGGPQIRVPLPGSGAPAAPPGAGRGAEDGRFDDDKPREDDKRRDDEQRREDEKRREEERRRERERERTRSDAEGAGGQAASERDATAAVGSEGIWEAFLEWLKRIESGQTGSGSSR